MSEKYDGQQVNIDRIQPLGIYYEHLYVHCGTYGTHTVNSKATRTSILVMDALNSVKELGTSYNDSSELNYLYQLGVSECEAIGILLSNEMVVLGISSSGTRVEYRVL